jgi:hypothetical protein
LGGWMFDDLFQVCPPKTALIYQSRWFSPYSAANLTNFARPTRKKQRPRQGSLQSSPHHCPTSPGLEFPRASD